MVKILSQAKLIYTFGFIFTTFIAYILSLQGANVVGSLVDSLKCDNSCFNFFAVFRISFGLVLYHGFLAILLFGCKEEHYKYALIHTSYWFWKTILWAICLICAFIAPYKFYEKYWIVVISFGSAFILIQLLLLVDFTCDVAESWINGYSAGGDDSGYYKLLLIICSIFSYSAVITMSVVLYIYYGACRINQAVVSLNLIFILLISALSINSKLQNNNPKFGLLQASFISLYGTYLVATALAANDITTCSVLPSSNTSLDITVKYIGLAFTFISLAYQAYSTGSTGITGDPQEKVSFSFFHFTFVLASFYLAGVLCQFTEVSVVDGVYIFAKGQTSYWMKIASSYSGYFLYTWVLVAPTIMSARKF